MKAVPHERYCLMLTDEIRQKRYACVDLGGGISAIMNRKTGSIKIVYESVANLCCMKSYEVFVVKDACASRNKDEHKAGLDAMKQNGAKITGCAPKQKRQKMWIYLPVCLRNWSGIRWNLCG